jgi:hypothetical protein
LLTLIDRMSTPISSTPPTSESLALIEAQVSASSAWIQPLRQEIARYLIGQTTLVDRLLISLLVKGHILLEGVPGLAKTLALKTLASLVNAQFHRIQFTPDMLPAVLIGSVISALVTLPLAWPLQASAHDLRLLALLGTVQLALPCLLLVRLIAVALLLMRWSR